MSKKVGYIILTIFMIVAFKQLTFATVPLQIGGSVFTEIRYTPEDLWNGGAGLALWSNLETKGGKINLDIIWSDSFGSGDFIWFTKSSDPKFSFKINSVTLTAEGPLLFSPKTSARVKMGDIGIDYSPWIGTLTEDHWRKNNLEKGDNHSRGISVEELKISLAENIFTEPISLNAFNSWFGSPEKFSYGFKIESEIINKFDTSISFMRYNDRPIVPKEEDSKYKKYGDPKDWEYGVELNVGGDITDNIDVDVLTGYWSRMDKTSQDEKVSALYNRLKLGWDVEKIGDFDFELYSFGKDFNPRFYERDYDDSRLNEVEQYLERIGTGVKLSTKLSENVIDIVDLSLGTDFHNLAKDTDELLYNESWIRTDKTFGSNEVNLKVGVRSAFELAKGIKYHSYHEYNDLLVNGRLKYNIIDSNNSLIGTRILAQYSNAEKSFVLDGNVNTEARTGLFQNFNVYAGLQHKFAKEAETTNGLQTYGGFEYKTPSGIQLTGRFATENVERLEFDEFKDISDKTKSYFSVKIVVYF
ncbi:MAG TPA: hypothetical protein PLO45_08425 [Defluviitoga sp.]|nr:hypothetical protein [Defluviitoga sp.]HOP25318.1 hypothetical protein [Defluviitoga sp.]HPZ74979.1 hypothetical protein [Candidatus Pacearchaeota archaeon]